MMGHTLVFVGCGAGLSDPNFGRLLEWSREALAHSPYPHYRLVLDSELAQADDAFCGIPVRPIPYGPDHGALGPFLSGLGERARARRLPVTELDRLSRVQADYRTRCESVDGERASLTASEYFRRRMELARELSLAGGLHRASLDIDGLFFHEASNLPRDERMRFGLEIADMLYDDALPQEAARLVLRLLPDSEAPDLPAEALCRFRQLHVRSLNDLCAYDDTLSAITRALSLAAGDERTRLEAQRAEIQLLQGHLDEAARGLDSGESH